MFFKKKPAEQVKTDRELVEFNGNSVESLIVLAGDYSEIVNELKILKEQLKYLIPSEKSKVMDYDKKIKGIIGDLRIELTKMKDKKSDKVMSLISDARQVVADRNVSL